MFGNNNRNSITQEQLEEMLAPLTERIDRLETEVRKQAERIVALERQLGNLSQAVAQPDASEDGQDTAANLNATSIRLAMREDNATKASPVESSATPLGHHATVSYLPAPTSDGLFLEDSRSEQVGKSIYQLCTEDGIKGQFIMLSTPDAIATATISVSQFVKPVCRIEGNIHHLPRQIETLEEGVVQKDGNVWKVVKKARVLFLP